MTFDWTDSKTWTFEPTECRAFANAAIQYCDNCADKYPDAQPELANLRNRANQLRTLREMSQTEFDQFCDLIAIERKSEGTGFSILAEYVNALRWSAIDPERSA